MKKTNAWFLILTFGLGVGLTVVIEEYYHGKEVSKLTSELILISDSLRESHQQTSLLKVTADNLAYEVNSLQEDLEFAMSVPVIRPQGMDLPPYGNTSFFGEDSGPPFPCKYLPSTDYPYYPYYPSNMSYDYNVVIPPLPNQAQPTQVP